MPEPPASTFEPTPQTSRCSTAGARKSGPSSSGSASGSGSRPRTHSEHDGVAFGCAASWWVKVFTNAYVNSPGASVTSPCHLRPSAENGRTRMPFGGAGLIATPAGEAAVEQQLDEEAAVGVTDQHGRLVERSD